MICDRFDALRHCFFGAAFCIVFPSSSIAESTSNLRIALSAVSPSVSWQGPFAFLNLGGGAALTGKRGIEMLRTLGPRFYLDAAVGQAIGVEQASPGSWTRATGFSLDYLEALFVFGEPPRAAKVFTLSSTAPATAELAKAWAARGFRETSVDGQSVWQRGQAGEMDLAKSDQSDPFNGVYGGASFLLHASPMLAQAWYPEVVLGIVRARSSGGLAARPDVVAMLAALEEHFSTASLISAVLVGNTGGFSADDGIDPFSAFVLADFDRGSHGAEAVMVLVFENCAAARSAIAGIERRWPETGAEVKALAPVWTAIGDRAPCPLIGRVRVLGSAEERNFGNPAFKALSAALYMRGLPLAYRKKR